MKLSVLASGSRANCIYVGTESAGFLFDAGLSPRQTEKRLRLLGLSRKHIVGMFISHDHEDHARHAGAFAKDWKINVYYGIQERSSILSFPVSHDAIDSVGFRIHEGHQKAVIVLDTGCITPSMAAHMAGANVLVLEANHHREMLRVGPYPWDLKQRILSRTGHLSNDAVAEYVGAELEPSCHTLILAHLSEANNHPSLVRAAVLPMLLGKGLQTMLIVSGPDEPTELIEV
mgnify:CR=1 FL=1